MIKRTALYLRVSTDGQTVENQLIELEAAAARHNWHIVKVFEDRGISGAKGRDKRLGFDKLLQGVTRKDFDLIAAWPSRLSPAIAMNGASFNVKRCLAFGYFVPVNSKKVDAGIRHRLLSPKRRPSERKLNTGDALGRGGGKTKVIGASSMVRSPAERITGAVSLIRTSSARRRSSSPCRGGVVTETDCTAPR